MSEFEVNINGVDRIAHVVARLKNPETKIEYIYYNVDDAKDEKGNYLLFASKIKINEDGIDEIIEIENEKEKEIAFNMFSLTYKSIQG